MGLGLPPGLSLKRLTPWVQSNAKVSECCQTMSLLIKNKKSILGRETEQPWLPSAKQRWAGHRGHYPQPVCPLCHPDNPKGSAMALGEGKPKGYSQEPGEAFYKLKPRSTQVDTERITNVSLSCYLRSLSTVGPKHHFRCVREELAKSQTVVSPCCPGSLAHKRPKLTHS